MNEGKNDLALSIVFKDRNKLENDILKQKGLDIVENALKFFDIIKYSRKHSYILLDSDSFKIGNYEKLNDGEIGEIISNYLNKLCKTQLEKLCCGLIIKIDFFVDRGYRNLMIQAMEEWLNKKDEEESKYKIIDYDFFYELLRKERYPLKLEELPNNFINDLEFLLKSKIKEYEKNKNEKLLIQFRNILLIFYELSERRFYKIAKYSEFKEKVEYVLNRNKSEYNLINLNLNRKINENKELKEKIEKLEETINNLSKNYQQEYRKRNEREYKKWTDNEELKLIELYKRNSNIYNISKKLERTPASIFIRLNKLGYLKHKIRTKINKRICQDCKRSIKFNELSWLINNEDFCFNCYSKHLKED